jgi:hypothetical protein
MQVCQSRLLAGSVLGERNGDARRSMRLLTKWRLNYPLPGRARRGRHMGFGYSATVNEPTLGGERCCCPPSSAERFVSLRAEMVPLNPGVRAGARGMVRPVRRSVDHATSRAGPALGAFASAEAPKRCIPPWRPSLGHPGSGMAHVTSGQRPSTSPNDVAMRYSNRRTQNLSSVAGLAHDAALDRGAACGRRRDDRQG